MQEIKKNNEETERTIKILDKHRDELLYEMNSLDHVLECLTIPQYEQMISFAIEKGFKAVCDIGCAYGHQSELCRDRIKYIGIDDGSQDFYNLYESFTRYIREHYPCRLFAVDKETTMAISVLALGWNCYKYSDDEYDKQFKALSEDFGASLLYVPIEQGEILKKYFKHVEIIEEEKAGVHVAVYYCHN